MAMERVIALRQECIERMIAMVDFFGFARLGRRWQFLVKLQHIKNYNKANELTHSDEIPLIIRHCTIIFYRVL